MQENNFDYQQGDTNFNGYYAYDKNVSGKRPAVIVFHAFEGCNALAKEYARKFADLGYVGIAPEQLTAFAEEMDSAGVDWQVHSSVIPNMHSPIMRLQK